jgi:hypothetical protein
MPKIKLDITKEIQFEILHSYFIYPTTNKIEKSRNQCTKNGNNDVFVFFFFSLLKLNKLGGMKFTREDPVLMMMIMILFT